MEASRGRRDGMVVVVIWGRERVGVEADSVMDTHFIPPH